MSWRRKGYPEINRRKDDRPLVLVSDDDGWIGVARVYSDGRWKRRGKRAMYAPKYWMPIPALPEEAPGEGGGS